MLLLGPLFRKFAGETAHTLVVVNREENTKKNKVVTGAFRLTPVILFSMVGLGVLRSSVAAYQATVRRVSEARLALSPRSISKTRHKQL